MIDAYERARRGRLAVLDQLRFLRGREPLEGYDTLDPEQIVAALGTASGETVTAVRDYERKLRRRASVMAAASRAGADGDRAGS